MTGDHPDHVPGLDALEPRQFRHLLAVADARSFTRAAEDLHLMQQALSASIWRLEEQLGVTLFVRTTRRVELTSAGQVLVEGARAVMAAAADALEQVRLASDGVEGRNTRPVRTARPSRPFRPSPSACREARLGPRRPAEWRPTRRRRDAVGRRAG